MRASIDIARSTERLRGSMSPLRRRLLASLREPASSTELAARLGETRQRVNYHMRELEKGGFVELLEERQRRGCTERVLRATARAVIIDGDLIGDPDEVDVQDRFATDTLIAASARTVRDVTRMRERAAAQHKRLVTFAIETDIAFERPVDIQRFADRLSERLAELAEEFDTGKSSGRYRVVVGGHPSPSPQPRTIP